MTAEHLLIDVGNGRTKFGLATRNEILQQRDAPTPSLGSDSLRALLKDWNYDHITCSSVVPQVTEILRAFFGVKLLVLRHDVKMGIGVKYPKPETIGPDRLANAVALAQIYGAPGIVIDFGTAVTFDIVDADACYVGGVIAPGLRLMTDYLHERTALLPRVELSEPLSVIGKSTEQAILAGAAIGYRGMIHGLLNALKKELGNPARLRVIATGGDAAWIASGIPEIESVDADLTLQGLRLVGNLHALA
ncbi:MAG: type III pantothenate kinase [Verrucomicrobia bacterium]|nr:type III pantothenate kinase [Verrucomicrobiota bacterium]